VVVITAAERAAFKRCRRAWDLGARVRRGLEPADGTDTAELAEHPAREALAVHYFPGMWGWDRTIVRPLVLRAAGEAAAFVERYVDWAEAIDDFEPLRVEFDFDARVPHPSGDGDLAAPDGRPVHYVGRVHALVVDDERDHWLLIHRFGPWTEPDVLRLDEAAVTAAWAWEQTFLNTRIRGVIYNELTLDGRFRRTRVRAPRDAVAHAGAQLAREVAEMLDPALALYPTPAEDCARCPFVAPCIEIQGGNDAEDLLARDFRPRPPEKLEEGRLGGSTWGMGRGAMPARFRDDER
jgi:hypothetical protein